MHRSLQGAAYSISIHELLNMFATRGLATITMPRWPREKFWIVAVLFEGRRDKKQTITVRATIFLPYTLDCLGETNSYHDPQPVQRSKYPNRWGPLHCWDLGTTREVNNCIIENFENETTTNPIVPDSSIFHSRGFFWAVLPLMATWTSTRYSVNPPSNNWDFG